MFKVYAQKDDTTWKLFMADSIDYDPETTIYEFWRYCEGYLELIMETSDKDIMFLQIDDYTMKCPCPECATAFTEAGKIIRFPLVQLDGHDEHNKEGEDDGEGLS